jgi:integrase
LRSQAEEASNHLPEDLLTQEDIEKLIDAAGNLRDKAFIALLYESGARKGEILGIQIKHIQFDERGTVATLPKGKTGARRIRIVFSTGYWRNWLDNHPDIQNREALVWASLKYPDKPMDYHTLPGIISKEQKKSRDSKACEFTFFRHVRALILQKLLLKHSLKFT